MKNKKYKSGIELSKEKKWEMSYPTAILNKVKWVGIITPPEKLPENLWEGSQDERSESGT